jgi:hypothetical protein
VSTFNLRPEVTAQIRPMMSIDAAQVAALHHADMGNSLWAQLGLPFLTQLYSTLIDSDLLLAFVYVDEKNAPLGFIAGSTDAAAMMREVATQSPLALALAALPALLRPRLLLKLFQTPLYFSRSDDTEAIPAESLFCSFVPELRGKGISGHINKYLFDELLARGHGHVKITTEVDNDGSNRQLQRWGFEERSRFRFYGKDMITYVLDLRASPRVDPVSRHPSI